MSPDGSDPDDDWRSFYEAYCRGAIRELARRYPDDRSLYVDVIDLHRYDPTFARALLADPDGVLDRAAAALRRFDGTFERVNVRLENHPGLLEPGDVRSRHAGELVSVQGVATGIGPVRARVEEAVYVCEACGVATHRVRSGPPIEPPRRCDDCGERAPPVLDRDRSTFVDVQRVTVAGLPSADRDGSPPRSIEVVLDDDLVGAVLPEEQLLATGVVRLERRGDGRFDFYLDGISVAEERPGGLADDDGSPAASLEELIESRWRRVTES